MSATVLVADDELLIRQSLRIMLQQEGFDVLAAASGEQAWSIFQSAHPDVVLLDLLLGDVDGMEILSRIRQAAPESKVVILSAHGSIERAVSAMKLGAYDFIKKPFELEEVLSAVRNALRQSSLEGRVEYLAQRDRRDVGSLVHRSQAMQAVLREVELIARSPFGTVLIIGESGVGKQLIARMVHDRSPRERGPFVELNCSAVPDALIESEFFGHERGAFSDARERKLGLVEVADGGTLFLDEIGDLSTPAQAKLLTFLESRTFRRVGATTQRRVDTRIVAATNRDLAKMVSERSFRADLWYRLNTMTVTLPPLRMRRDDIGPLAEHFVLQASKELHRRFARISPAALAALCAYGWPGNVRELRSVISRAVLLHDDVELRPEHLPALAAAAPSEVGRGAASSLAEGTIPTLAEIELAHIRRVLEHCRGNRTQAAQHLGITRQTLAKKLELGADAAHSGQALDEPATATADPATGGRGREI